MSIKWLNIGFGNVVNASRIISIITPESAPIKRIIQSAKDENYLIDVTHGRRTRSVIITDCNTVILSAIQPETIANRLQIKESTNNEIEN